MTQPDKDTAVLCASCKIAQPVIALRHRQFCRSLSLSSPNAYSQTMCFEIHSAKVQAADGIAEGLL